MRILAQRVGILTLTLQGKHDYVPILQVRRLTLREAEYLASGHAARKQQNGVWKSGLPDAGARHLPKLNLAVI